MGHCFHGTNQFSDIRQQETKVWNCYCFCVHKSPLLISKHKHCIAVIDMHSRVAFFLSELSLQHVGYKRDLILGRVLAVP